MAATAAFRDLHSVGGTVGNRADRSNPAGSEPVEVFQADLEDTPVAAQPEVVLAVFENLINDVMEQPVLCGERGELTVPESIKPTAVGADPEIAGAVLVE